VFAADGHRRPTAGAWAPPRPALATQKVWALDLRALEVFVTISAERSFRRTAHRLRISPASVSQAVAKLERHVGCRLFDRSTRHVRPTAAGQALLDGARAVLDQARAFEASARGLNGRPSVRVGVMHGMHAGAVARATASNDAPLVLLQDEGWSDPTCGLATSRTDLAILSGPTDHDHDLVRCRLADEPVVALLARSVPIAAQRCVSLDELDKLGWARVAAPDGRWRAHWRLDHVRGGPPREHPTVHHSPASLLFAIRRGDVVHATVPAFADLFDLAGLVMVPVRDVPAVPTDVAYRRSQATPVVDDLARRVVAAAAG
jgi:DNA-binding transcriptional LysR family regulator